MIRVENLTKSFGSRTVVDHVSFTVAPGRVTGFLGPNGAGKSTTLRMILGLDAPDEGSALINGAPYRTVRNPLTTVGALLDSAGAHRARTAKAHLTWLAHSNGIPRTRVSHVLERVGLAAVATTRTGRFSLGMGQRLGIAAALLGDPRVLILDEPANGLDPEGIRWIRGLLTELAADGRTVLISSHLMSEMAETADDLIVISAGRVVAHGPLDDLVAGHPSLEAAFFALTEGTTRHRTVPGTGEGA